MNRKAQMPRGSAGPSSVSFVKSAKISKLACSWHRPWWPRAAWSSRDRKMRGCLQTKSFAHEMKFNAPLIPTPAASCLGSCDEVNDRVAPIGGQFWIILASRGGGTFSLKISTFWYMTMGGGKGRGGGGGWEDFCEIFCWPRERLCYEVWLSRLWASQLPSGICLHRGNFAGLKSWERKRRGGSERKKDYLWKVVINVLYS